MMPSYAKLYASMKIVKQMRLLEIVNASDDRASDIVLWLEHEGVDVSHFLTVAPPKSIAPRDRAVLLLSSKPGPQDVELFLSWVDDAGIPGVWNGVVRRY